MKSKVTYRYKYKSGQHVSLDEIYGIQGLDGGDWWDPISDELDDELIITDDITIIIKVERG